MDNLFFIASKLIWALVRPESLLLLLFALAWLLAHLGRVRRGQSFGLVAILTTCVIAVVPVGDAVLGPLETTYPTEPEVHKVAGIIVLGGGEIDIQSNVWSQPNTGDAGDRFITALSLAHKYPEAIVLFTGGSGRLMGGTSGADIARDILLGAGFDKSRLILEGASRNTAENATMSLELVPDSLDGEWLLVTSAFHMRRAVASFCAAGWKNIVPWPTDYRTGGFADRIGWDFALNLDDLNTGVREWIGLAAYSLTRRTSDAIEISDCLAVQE
ncbi:MAG: YdcF family protein [Alphaproteobacteria bacterium]|nr:YdcF family protein [Alphaproteobacteria bacterium]